MKKLPSIPAEGIANYQSLTPNYEGLRADIRQVAEGHQFLVDGQARIIDRIDRLEHELGAMIRFSYASAQE
jgi:hypothetical protein